MMQRFPGIYSQGADRFPTSPLVNTRKQRRTAEKTVTFDCTFECADPAKFQPMFDQSTFKQHLEDIQVCE